MFSRPQFLLPALSLVVGLFLDQSAGAVTCTLGFPAPVSLGAAPCLPSQLFENTWVIPASGPGVTGAEAMGPSGENIEPRRELPLTLAFEGATFTPGPTEGPTEEQGELATFYINESDGSVSDAIQITRPLIAGGNLYVNFFEDPQFNILPGMVLFGTESAATGFYDFVFGLKRVFPDPNDPDVFQVVPERLVVTGSEGSFNILVASDGERGFDPFHVGFDISDLIAVCRVDSPVCPQRRPTPAPTPNPEPTSLSLLVVGLSGIFFLVRLYRSRAIAR